MWLKPGLLLCSVWYASASVSADSAFDALKSLQGNWAIQSEGKPLTIQMSYDTGSKGSIVTERFGKELSVFYRDGENLMMLHFCNAGNQPHLRLESTSEASLLKFQTIETTNLSSPDAPHVQEMIYRFVSPDTIKLEIVWQKGESRQSEKYQLTRIRTALPSAL